MELNWTEEMVGTTRVKRLRKYKEKGKGKEKENDSGKQMDGDGNKKEFEDEDEMKEFQETGVILCLKFSTVSECPIHRIAG